MCVCVLLGWGGGCGGGCQGKLVSKRVPVRQSEMSIYVTGENPCGP